MGAYVTHGTQWKDMMWRNMTPIASQRLTMCRDIYVYTYVIIKQPKNEAKFHSMV